MTRVGCYTLILNTDELNEYKEGFRNDYPDHRRVFFQSDLKNQFPCFVSCSITTERNEFDIPDAYFSFFALSFEDVAAMNLLVDAVQAEAASLLTCP